MNYCLNLNEILGSINYVEFLNKVSENYFRNILLHTIRFMGTHFKKGFISPLFFIMLLRVYEGRSESKERLRIQPAQLLYCTR